MDIDIDFKLQCDKEKNLELDGLYSSVKDDIMTIIKKEGYLSHKIYKKLVTSVGGNCFGVLYEINIKGETIEGNKEINIFLKQVIPNSEDFKLISVSHMYNREHFIYKDFGRVLTELQDYANVLIKDRFNLVKYYDTSSADALILENLSIQGFKTYGRMELMNINYSEVCAEQLAKFHSISFIIKKKMPDYFENKIKPLKHLIVIDESYKNYESKNYEIATKKLQTNIKNKIDKWWEAGLENYSNFFNGNMTNVKCLCHGDFKMNNILYKEIDGKITDVIPVDYQLIHYGSPILDFIYFICMATDQEFRRKYLGHLKDYYHKSMQTYLEHFDISIDDVYPKKEFEKDFQVCRDYAVLSCVFVLPFIISSEDSFEVVDERIIKEGLKLDDRYYERLQGVIDDFLDI